MNVDPTTGIEQTVSGLGYEFVAIIRAGRGLVRVFIDHPRGVTVEDCVAVSNQLTRWFAVEGVDYERLEVSSPGLDRPLRRWQDYVRFVGSQVRLRLHAAAVGTRRQYTGRLVSADEERIVLEHEGGVLELTLAEIERAQLVPEF